MACPYNVASVHLVLTVIDSNRALTPEELIQTCPDVCNVVFGNGNPDLAGIGVSFRSLATPSGRPLLAHLL